MTTSPPASHESGVTGMPTTVYFDGACPVCSREIAVYQHGPGGQAIRWVDVTRCGPGELGPGLNREAALARLHLRHGDGQLVSGAAAFTGLWKQLPRWRWLGLVFGSGLRLAALELAYRLFLWLRRVWRRA